jgi:hypothetical protein
MKLLTAILALAATGFALPQGGNGIDEDIGAIEPQPFHHHHHHDGDCCPKPCPPHCDDCLDDETAEKLAATWL